MINREKIEGRCDDILVLMNTQPDHPYVLDELDASGNMHQLCLKKMSGSGFIRPTEKGYIITESGKAFIHSGGYESKRKEEENNIIVIPEEEQGHSDWSMYFGYLIALGTFIYLANISWDWILDFQEAPYEEKSEIVTDFLFEAAIYIAIILTSSTINWYIRRRKRKKSTS